jgi:hypothetical protein
MYWSMCCLYIKCHPSCAGSAEKGARRVPGVHLPASNARGSNVPDRWITRRGRRDISKMKNVKRIHIALLTASLLLPSNLGVHAQSPQQSGDPTKAGSNATKQPEKKNPDGAAAPTKNSSNNSTASTAPDSGSSSKATAPQKTAPAKNAGMVWVNTESGVYHKRGTRWYGKTKQGKYMLEADAIKAGYKASGRN